MGSIAAAKEPQEMLYWIATACREARETAERYEVNVAASLAALGGPKDQATINRFENHKTQPNNIDRTVRAYADDLGIEPIEIWRRALEMWDQGKKR